MSLARLAALALRGAAPPGMARLPVAPAFDPLVALDAAMPIPAEASPAMRRQSAAPRLAAPMPALQAMAPLAVVHPGEVAIPATPPPPRMAASEPGPPGPAEFGAAPPPPAATPVATAPLPLSVLPTAPLPAGHAAPIVSPAVRPRDPSPSRAVPLAPQPTLAAAQAASGHNRASMAFIPPSVQPSPPRQSAPETSEAAPDIHIGRIEVVMAAPTPPPALPAPAAPPRDFARYAAMRGLRDRRW